MRMILAILALGSILSTAAAQARGGMEGRFLRLPDGISRYVEIRPPQAGRPTVVMVNGLVYATERWNPFRQALAQKGYGLVNYDFRGQRWTLKEEAKNGHTPAFFEQGLNPTLLAEELRGVLDALGAKGPVVLVSLSYGSHIAAEFARLYPDRVLDVVFMAPLVVSLDHYDPQGMWVMMGLEWLKFTWGPVLGPYFHEQAYAQIYRTYYRQNLVPAKIPAELRHIPEIYRESIFHLTRAARDFDLRRYDFQSLRGPRVHFMTAGEEEPLALRDQFTAFERVRPASRGVLVHFTKAFHAIPDADGARAAGLLDRILTRDSFLRPNTKFRMTDQGLELWNDAHAVTPHSSR
ncbi:MAG: alpha/beta fold hydrolase [Bdellovibrionaceae bacterium]|nr:alpha/beta fold hydrolase [Pseudobdellovibrionaceae bacterium]